MMIRHHITRLCISFICILSVSGISLAADEPSDTASIVDELLAVSGFKESWDLAVEECLSSTKSMMETELEIESHKETMGISTDDPDWPRLKAIYEEYYAGQCEYMTYEEYTALWHEAFARDLSDDELQAALDFYNSDIGQKLVKADLKADARFQRKANDKMTANSFQAQAEFEKKLERLLEKRLERLLDPERKDDI